MFDIKENLKKLPDTPGVYMHKDSLGQVIYVGKAISLRNRVRQYFQTYGKSTPKLRALTSQIAEFEYITCASEMEAFILECNLIKKYQPKYNVLLRDDKTYPYIMVSTSEPFPRVIKTRELKNDGNKYFGPFSDVGAVNQMVELINSTYRLKRCAPTVFNKGHRPCLNYHIGQCQGMCLLSDNATSKFSKDYVSRNKDIDIVNVKDIDIDIDKGIDRDKNIDIDKDRDKDRDRDKDKDKDKDKDIDIDDVDKASKVISNTEININAHADTAHDNTVRENTNYPGIDIYDEYRKKIEDILGFLSGRNNELVKTLKLSMEEASNEMRFEDAAKYRDLVLAADALSQAQRVTMVSGKDMDVVLPVYVTTQSAPDKTHSAVSGSTGLLGSLDSLGASGALDPTDSSGSSGASNDLLAISTPISVVLFQVRNGKLVGRETFDFTGEEVQVGNFDGVDKTGETDRTDEVESVFAENGEQFGQGNSGSLLVSEFIKQYYTKWADVPHDILVEELPDEVELLEDFLAIDRSHKVHISVPKRGENRALLLMAQKDRDELGKTISARKASHDEKQKALREEIEFLLEQAGYLSESRAESKCAKESGGVSADTSESRTEGTDDNVTEKEYVMPLGHDASDHKKNNTKMDYRVEAYDISNTNGVDSVGAMVVFQGNRKVRKDYRRFKIKTVVGPDDYASLEEMITRRLLRAQKGDPAFAVLPDIIFMDGGLGQVNSARKAMATAGYDIPVVGLAKDDSHRTRAVVFADGSELDLRERPLLFKYAGTIQEEVHRFAIEYHRGLHGKKAISSVLDEIPGIGPVRRNALLAHFGSVDKIKAATESELSSVSGMDARAAKAVREFFDK